MKFSLEMYLLHIARVVHTFFLGDGHFRRQTVVVISVEFRIYFSFSGVSHFITCSPRFLSIVLRRLAFSTERP